MATVAAFLPDESKEFLHAQKRADADFHGRMSGYVRHLVERDMAGSATSDAMSPTIVVDLTRQLLGEPAAQLMVEVFARSPRPDAQARFLRRMLQDELRAFEAAEAYVEEQQAPYAPLFVDVPKRDTPTSRKKKA